ncbi:hypothetical protein LCGC14_2538630 [marine sediment metagenome]|uniref:Pyruvate/ketoisovalerate oxidoreductase catalytic domain-containing protein n=1 Tax=marine sediment metagenome TaxID=412755 RepID=A0A0F9ARE5_9ZZZZ
MAQFEDSISKSEGTNRNKKIETLQNVIIRFAGDSGDGMQLTGMKFTTASTILGNDVATFPDYPAEIRAPAGTLAGVSGYQVHFASSEIYEPGDVPDCLVIMNPAALKVNIKDLKSGGILIANEDAFTQNNLKKVGYSSNPLDDNSLKNFEVFKVKMATLDAITFKYHVQFEKRLDKMEEITMRIPLMDAKLDLLLKRSGLALGRNQ